MLTVNHWDTRVIDAVLGRGVQRPANLVSLMLRYLGVNTKRIKPSDYSWDWPLTPDRLAYCAEDVRALPAIHRAQRAQAEANHQMAAVALECRVSVKMAAMMRQGVAIDVAALAREIQTLMGAVEAHAAGLPNVNSAKQVKAALIAAGVPAASIPSTSKPALIQMRHPLATRILEQRGRSKLVSMLLAVMQNAHNGRIYPRYMSYGAATGRMSSSEPNIQQMPNGHRGWIKDDGLHGVDWSQMQMRIAAIQSGDPTMQEDLRHESDPYAPAGDHVVDALGLDLDRWTARRSAKHSMLAMIMGGGHRAIAKTWARDGDAALPPHLVNEIVATFRARYTQYQGWAQALAVASGAAGQVNIGGGYFRAVDQDTAWLAANTVLQGMEARILKETICRVTTPPALLLHDQVMWYGGDYERQRDAARDAAVAVVGEALPFTVAWSIDKD